MNKTVLVVDDDGPLREGICESLSDEGYQAVAFGNGRDALTWLRSAAMPPCLIVLDLMMPVMNGWQFRDEQKKDPKLAQIPVVVVTATGKLDRSTIDADEVISKPFTLDNLLDAAARYCAC